MYNAEATICRALDSVKNQEYDGSFEILVVNDGSTDRSAAVVEAYRAQNPEMNIVLIQQQNQGVSATRNTAMKAATGEYLALLDSDDEWLPAKTAKQMNVLVDKTLKIDFVSCLRNSETIGWPYLVELNMAKVTFRKLLLRHLIPPTSIFKKEIVKEMGGFDEQMRYGEDYDFYLRVSRRYNMAVLNESLAVTGGGKRSFGVSGLSSNLVQMEKGFQYSLLKLYRQGFLSAFEYILYKIYFNFKYFLRKMR